MQYRDEILRQVKKIEISTKHLVDGLLTGNYHSVFKGQGIEFSEIREYRIGDDIRSIDWNVTARFNHPYVKEFIEERDLRIYFLIDMSASGSFGRSIQKKRKMLEISASLMFSAFRNNDKIGVLLFTDTVEQFMPARKGKKYLLKILTKLLTFAPNSKHTDIATAMKQAGKILKKRSVLFVISDFIYSGDFSHPLKVLRARHDVIAIKISDLREEKIPDVGLIELEDEETGEQILVNTSDPEFQRNYTDIVADSETKLTQQLRKQKIDFLKVRSDEEYAVPLKKFFRKRIRRH